VLSDTRIQEFMKSGDIVFTDEDGEAITLDDSQFQPVSVDLTLDQVERPFGRWLKDGREHWNIRPYEFTLASVREVLTLSPRVAAIAAGKSTVARRALQVEAAGLIDCGWSGQLTLEMVHFGRSSIVLTEGMPICQVMFFEVDGPVARPYGSKGLRSRYQGQLGPTHAREDPQS
jgi:deoxycytidine triphosphate deaminase